jgi:hypothetical protein
MKIGMCCMTMQYVKGKDVERQHGGVWIQSHEHEHGCD